VNEYLRALMDKPSCDPGCCCVCGNPRQLNAHHAVLRSQGGSQGPTITLCGSGTTGCHGEAHAGRLYFRWDNGWWKYLQTSEPVKYEKALEMDGWRDVF
jgi:hypothetical protein